MDSNIKELIEKVVNYEYNLGKVAQMENTSQTLMNMAKDEYSRSNDEFADTLRNLSIDFKKRGERARSLLNEFCKNEKEVAWSILNRKIQTIEFSDAEMDFILKPPHWLMLE